MELPSMVQRSGDTLIVRSVVSGNQLYLDQVKNPVPVSADPHSPSPNHRPPHYNNNNNSNANANSNTNVNVNNSALEHQIETIRAAAAAAHQQQQHFLQQQQQNVSQQLQAAVQQQAALELKDEGLPQCKIKRNYSCTYCPYFTQNPRYHLTHLRDVHGEKIVINKCKLCLYASRHFQKLVRHMKMVHGCTDGITGAQGQTRGKRGMNREARKRKLEQSVGIGANVGAVGGVSSINGPEMPTLEQVKRELELQEQKLQREIQAFNKQQEEHKQQQLAANTAEAIFAAYESQRKAQQREMEALHARSMAVDDMPQAAHQLTSTGASGGHYPSAAHQQSRLPNRPSIEVISSPASPASPVTDGAPDNGENNAATALSLSYTDEAPQNRLLKCSICDFTTLYRAQLVDHEMEEHCKTKFFRCEKCSYVTHIKARFSKHVKYHSMPMIKCDTCDFRTPYKWNLDRHMKNHGGAGPFKCAACNFTADIKQSLTVHEMNHHVPPVGHAAGMPLARRRNKVGATDLSDDFLSDSADLLDDHYNNNHLDEYEESLLESYAKKCKYDDEEPTDLSQKGGSSDTSSVHNQSAVTSKAKRPVPNLIPIPNLANNVLNLSKDLVASRSSLHEIASMFFNEKQLSEMLQPLDKASASQLSPSTTTTSTSSHHSRSLLQKKGIVGNFFDKLKSSALTGGGPNENLICPCGHMAKCLSESIIHRKSCTLNTIAEDDMDEEQDDTDGRLEIDFADDDDKQSHSALNLSVTGSTRCQHCRHRCKSSADLLNHLKQCSEAGRCSNESFDSMSGESSAGRGGGESAGEQHHPMENRVFIWNKMPRTDSGSSDANQRADSMARNCGRESVGSNVGSSGGGNGSGNGNGSNDENSYYGVETAPGYGEVTKKMTPEEEAANSSLKKVYKCPHCSFWASTASRFHVHIVGHLNKKPFECSLCSYRSNWRWDITKHIRLKTIRDPSHKSARVLMNDETGRRNYTKYNKYITLMKVTEEDGDPKLMKSGEMTPNQVASLAFLNDFNKNVTINGSLSGTHLNGVREDITLEPIASKAAATTDTIDSKLNDEFIRLPLLATMMNAAMATQQQQQKDHDQQHSTLITPSVTISAVKRTPPPAVSLTDDLLVDVKQEGNEKKTVFKCRKCGFRHNNRDAVLAHIKVHYQDPNYPIVTATATSSQKAANGSQQQRNSPLQVAVSSNLYMNKVFAAMCLSQQQNSNSSAINQKHPQQHQHSLLSGGILPQSPVQGPAPNSPLSGLALALAGKNPNPNPNSNPSSNSNPTKPATSILEHGEQKDSHNEASAQSLSSSTTQATCQSSSPPSSASPYNSAVGGGSVVGDCVNAPPSSLQHLLTSPRGTYSSHVQYNQQSTTTATGGGVGSNNNNSNLVIGVTGAEVKDCNINMATYNLTSTATSTTAISTAQTSQSSSTSSPTSPISPISAPTSVIVTTLPNNTTITTTTTTTTTTTPTSPPTSNSYHNRKQTMQLGLIGASSSVGGMLNNSNSPRPLRSAKGINNGGGESVCIGGVIYESNNRNLTSHKYTTSTSAPTTTTTTSCNLLLNSATNNSTTQIAPAATAATSSSCSSSNATNFNNLNSNQNLLANDSERRDPSPYRCGHCHQVSNWKHVIQRHCRLKHAGDIRIETLDRSAINERCTTAPVYRPLCNGATNDSNNYGITLKALQQHQNNLNNNNNPVLMNKNERLLHSPLSNSGGANTSQDLQVAAAAYLAAAYKAAATVNASTRNGTANSAASMLGGEDYLLQQQLQQNDQIEITRLPPTGSGAGNGTASNLAQLLENNNASAQQNSKSKQQKCPQCPYISESKSQMNYHISLHKPTQYECHMCSFVCAKKQHLSSHMRTVHQQVNSSANSVSGMNLDFSVALQLAAAVQQDPSSLAIDLTALRNTLHNAPGHTPQQALQAQHSSTAAVSQLPPEYQYKMITNCPKCPARFAQKHNDEQSSKLELEEHLRTHGAAALAYKCEFCNFKAPHETLIQTHRYVHTQHYQDKYNELYRNCKEDGEHPAPKLMQLTLRKNVHAPETIWIVDTELSEQAEHEQQTQSQTPPTSNANFDNANSLLKKQLEAGPAPMPKAPASPLNSPSPKPQDADESSNTPSTIASVATSDLAVDAGSDSLSTVASPAPLEKCMHCPYETTNITLYKSHLQHHICITNQPGNYTCDHCDYTEDAKELIDDHTRLHFNAMEKLKSVAFFTSYDNLELSIESDVDTDTLSQPQPTHETQQSDCEQEYRIKIKEEHNSQEQNNNNEEDVVNENTVKEQQQQKTGNYTKSPDDQNERQPKELPPPTSTEPLKRLSNKIILYKNDGCLSIKKETNSGDNISDRLRRRGSRNNSCSSSDEARGHKAILVNAKTGQIIGRE